LKKLLLSSTSYLPEKNAALRSAIYDVSVGGFNNWANELLLDDYDVHSIVYILDDVGFDGSIDYQQQKYLIDPLLVAIKQKRLLSNKPIIIFLVSNDGGNVLRHVKSHHIALQNKADIIRDINLSGQSSIFVIDINAFLCDGSIYNDRNWYAAHCRLSLDCLAFVKGSLESVCDRFFTARKKILVLDCDNTIWGGVIGEDGIGGIKLGGDGLGAVFKDFQKVAIDLYKEGILLALSSKNEEFDVFNVLENHEDCLIKKDHLVSYKINWNEKSANIAEISRELDLSLGGFVFWDDNPIEREKVKKILPQVFVVEPPDEISEWPRYLRKMLAFESLTNTNEDSLKNEQYKARAKFVEGAKTAADIFDYLRSIKISPSIIALSESNAQRAIQLCQKTNQYNLRTKRHALDELYEMNNSLANSVFMFKVSDIYGDHGIVGLVAVKKIDDKTIFLDTFLMSCRVLGRELDKWIVNELVQYSKNNNFTKIIGNFIATERNSVSSGFFEDNGFTVMQYAEFLREKGIDENGTFYQLNVDSFFANNLEIFNG
jgi:FkbH-like protein